MLTSGSSLYYFRREEQAEHALATDGVEGLRRYYDACLSGSGHRVKTILEGDKRKTLESERERFMSMYLGAARWVIMGGTPSSTHGQGARNLEKAPLSPAQHQRNGRLESARSAALSP
jgi:hypothetical protein